MRLTEIVSCYLGQRVPRPDDLRRLRASFVENGFAEKDLGGGKWLYRRGVRITLELNYQSEASQIQVCLREIGGELEISVGNWGFPFEPLLSKKRYARTLACIVDEIATHGALVVRRDEAYAIADLAIESAGTPSLSSWPRW